jgi:hypothetical protein
MMNNPDRQKPEIKPYLHQLSLDCIKKLVDCVEQFNKGEIDADTIFILKPVLVIPGLKNAEDFPRTKNAENITRAK